LIVNIRKPKLLKLKNKCIHYGTKLVDLLDILFEGGTR